MGMVKKVLTADALAATGLRNRWYAVCPSSFVAPGALRRLTRLGEDWILFREPDGTLHMLEDRCPHRGAPLSQGTHMGDRIQCAYHGVQVNGSGTVVSVPGMPGCNLEGKTLVPSLPIQEVAGAVLAYFGDDKHPTPAELTIPEALTDPEISNFICYTEWSTPWRFAVENVLDPMHGTFLHQESHTMFTGDTAAQFRIRESEHGFFFEKTTQQGVNFDWVEYAHRHRLAAAGDPLSAGRRPRRIVRHHRHGHAHHRRAVRRVLLALPHRLGLAARRLALPLQDQDRGTALERPGTGPPHARGDGPRRRPGREPLPARPRCRAHPPPAQADREGTSERTGRHTVIQQIVRNPEGSTVDMTWTGENTKTPAPAPQPASVPDEIVIDQVSKVFRRKKSEAVYALENMSLTVREGEIVSLIGPSGCGKNTLLMLIAGLDRPTSGSVQVRGTEVTKPNPDVGVVFQRDLLFDWRSVIENVLTPFVMGTQQSTGS